MIEIFHFLTFQVFRNESGKIFSIGEYGMNLLSIPTIPQNAWPKDLEDKYFQPMY